MKTLTLVLVVAISGLAVASVQFARRAASEKARADAEVVLRQKQDARIRELEKSYADLSMQLQDARRFRGTVAASPGPRTASLTAGAAPERFEPRQAAQGEIAPLPRAFMRGPMDSEAGRKFMRTQMRGSLRRLYEDVGRDLSLSNEQADKLVDLLADQQSRGFGPGRPMPTDRASAQQAWQDLQAQNNKEIAALLGDAKMAELKEYQQTLPQRSQVDVVGQQLNAAGLPLSADQRSDLVTAMVAEAKANPRPTPVQGAAPEDVQKQMNDWQESYEKSVSERAKQVLSSEQYERYHDYEEWMAEMRKNLPASVPGRGFRWSAGGGGSFAPPPGAAVTVGPIMMSTDSVVIAPAAPASRQ